MDEKHEKETLMCHQTKSASRVQSSRLRAASRHDASENAVLEHFEKGHRISILSSLPETVGLLYFLSSYTSP